MSYSKFTLDNLKDKKESWQQAIAEVELNQIKSIINKDGISGPYKATKRNSWIIITLRDKKQRSKLEKCNTLVLAGSGMYPYSMFDVYNQYPHINQIGLEIMPKRADMSRLLVQASPAREKINIITIDANDYDYSSLDDDDLVFVSADVDSKKIINKVIETSKAHIYVCAPYNKMWLKSVVSFLP